MVAQILLRDSRQGSAKVLFDSQRRTGQLLGCFYRAKLFTFYKLDQSLAHFLASKRRPGKLFFYFLCYLKTLELKLTAHYAELHARASSAPVEPHTEENVVIYPSQKILVITWPHERPTARPYHRETNVKC